MYMENTILEKILLDGLVPTYPVIVMFFTGSQTMS